MLLRTVQLHYRVAHRNLYWSRVRLSGQSGQGLYRHGGACCAFTTGGKLSKEQPVDTSKQTAKSSKGIAQSVTDKVRNSGEKEFASPSNLGNKKPGTLLSETTVTSKEQRKVDWAIMKEMAKYLWPKVSTNYSTVHWRPSTK